MLLKSDYKEDAREAREKANVQREEAVQKRRQEREKLEKRMEENGNADIHTDTVEISEEGKVLLKDNIDLDRTASAETKTDVVKEPVTYTKTGLLSLQNFIDFQSHITYTVIRAGVRNVYCCFAARTPRGD